MKKILNNKLISKLLIFISSVYCSLMIFSINVFAVGYSAESKTDLMPKLKEFFKEYGLVFNCFIGFVVITNILIFIYHFCKLGAQACDHPLIRRQVLNDLIVSGICLGLIGGAGTIYAILFAIIMK